MTKNRGKGTFVGTFGTLLKFAALALLGLGTGSGCSTDMSAPTDGPVAADAPTVTTDAQVLGPTATALAQVAFARPVYSTITAGDNVIALFADKDFAVVDMRDPHMPQTFGPFTTAGKVLAGEYDELRTLGF